MQPFRFAVQSTKATSAAEWRALVHQVEGLGYSTLFVADHYIGPGPAGAETLLEPQHLAPLAAMAAAAAWTTTLRIGCRVFCVDYHVPAALAKEAATIDLLSDGRLEFGIGAGANRGEYRAMGLTFAEPSERVDKLEEMIKLVKAHWAGGQIDCRGRYISVEGYEGLPRPVQKPHPPIMVGGAKKRVLSLAARHADIVSLSNTPWIPRNEVGLTPMEEAERRFGFVKDAAGPRLADLEIESSPYWTQITDDVDAALLALSPRLRNADPEVLRDHPNVLIGPVSAVVDRLERRREVTGVSYVTVPADVVAAFAPVVSRLAGR